MRKGRSVNLPTTELEKVRLFEPLIATLMTGWKSAAIIYETTTNLDDAHRQARLFGQLLPDVPGRLRCLAKGRLQHLQLLGLDRGPRASPFVAVAALVQVCGRSLLILG